MLAEPFFGLALTQQLSAVVERYDLVRRYAVDDERPAQIIDGAEQQFAFAVPIGVDSIDQLHARISVKMLAVGGPRRKLPQVAVVVLARNDRHPEGQFGVDGRRRCWCRPLYARSLDRY